MLISFSVKNWRSFRDEQTFNLVASDESPHFCRLPHIAEYDDLRILPTAAVYGGNASGKSNLFKALKFAKEMVVTGYGIKSRLPVEPFRLDSVSKNEPTTFELVFLVEDEDGLPQVYAYEFSLSPVRVEHEKLVHVRQDNELVLFVRRQGEATVFHPTVEEDHALSFVLGSTRDNQLFLTNAASQNMSQYRSRWIFQVLDWFGRLIFIGPKTSAGFTEYPAADHSNGEEGAMYQLGTGILHFDFIDENLPQHEIRALLGDQSEESLPSFLQHPSGNRFVIDKGPDGLRLQRLVSVHRGDRGQEVRFDLADDSDGTVRLLDLLPCFQQVAAPDSRRVCVIDELDRSLHTLLVRRLLECFLDSCSPGTRSQILFTTHDVFQMDQNLLRRDEMWLTQRRRDGSTELIPLSSFKDIRNDKSVRTSYLRGQLGGIPELSLSDILPSE